MPNGVVAGGASPRGGTGIGVRGTGSAAETMSPRETVTDMTMIQPADEIHQRMSQCTTGIRQSATSAFHDYDVKAVLFDPAAKLWSVTFDRTPSRRPPVCLIGFVHDETQDTEASRCG